MIQALFTDRRSGSRKEKYMRKGSIKNNRINGEVLRELSVIIRNEVKDPRIDPLLSITRVEVLI